MKQKRPGLVGLETSDERGGCQLKYALYEACTALYKAYSREMLFEEMLAAARSRRPPLPEIVL